METKFKKGERIVIVKNEDSNLVGRLGKIHSVNEKTGLYKVRCGKNIIKDYVTDDCLTKL